MSACKEHLVARRPIPIISVLVLAAERPVLEDAVAVLELVGCRRLHVVELILRVAASGLTAKATIEWRLT